MAACLGVFWIDYLTVIVHNSKCIFLDRDGVLNADRPDYVYLPEHFELLPDVHEALQKFKDAGFLLIVITNQSGISKGIYTQQDMENIHALIQKGCGNLIDHFYFSPYHPSISESLSRKPGSLLFEKALSKFNINPAESWMVGDRDRDLIPAQKMGIRTIRVGKEINNKFQSDAEVQALVETVPIILK